MGTGLCPTPESRTRSKPGTDGASGRSARRAAAPRAPCSGPCPHRSVPGLCSTGTGWPWGKGKNKRVSQNPPFPSTDCPILCLVAKGEETCVQYIRSGSELPFSSHVVFQCHFFLICLQNLLSFGFAAKGEKLWCTGPGCSGFCRADPLHHPETLFCPHTPCLSFAGTLTSPWLGRLEKLSSSQGSRATAPEMIFLLEWLSLFSQDQ